MAAAAAGTRCLSDLPDELLQRILFFVPGKEAASTAVLSRRWRSLWRASGAVYLDSRYFVKERARKRARLPPWMVTESTPEQERRDFLHRVEEALAAATAPITRLTLVVKGPCTGRKRRLDVHDDEEDPVGAVISSPAARHVEELHVEAFRPSLTFGSISSRRVLRVLRLIGSPPRMAAGGAAAAFLRLAELHLHKCTVSVGHLKATIDAAPQLATLHIEFCCIDKENEDSEVRVRRYRLICPEVSDLVFEDCIFQTDELGLELHAPGLKRFRFKGPLQICNRFLRKPPTPSTMIEVDLHLIYNSHAVIIHKEVCLPKLFWKFIQNFSTTKLLKLKLDFSMDMLFPYIPSTLFHKLERFELDAQYYYPAREESMSVLASLLHCCPVVRDLRLKLSKDLVSRMDARSSIDQGEQEDFDKSVDRFRSRYRRRSQRSLDVEDEDHSYEGSCYIPVLSEQSFRFMESCLRRVSLQFCMDKPNCLGVKLAKFFAEKAVVLQELHIDDGSHKMLDHINHVCRRWIANSTKKARGLA